jgi:hypothetical protein
MKVLLHTNGIPFFLAGGYNTQIRKLLRIYHDAGHTVRLLLSGIETGTHDDLNMYSFSKVIETFQICMDDNIDAHEVDVLQKITYNVYKTNNPRIVGPGIPISQTNKYITAFQADLFISLCDALIHNIDVPEFSCKSVIWWPSHYDPPDATSLKAIGV